MIRKAVLLAIGKPTHRHHSDVLSGLPEALIPIANRPLVVHAIDSFRATGVREVAVLTEPELASEVQQAVCEGGRPDWDFEVTYLESADHGAAKAPLSALGAFVEDEPFALHLCDSVSRAGLCKVLASVADDAPDAVVVTHKRASVTDDTDVDVAAEHLPGRPNGDLSSTAPAGVYVFGPGILRSTPLPEPSATYELALIAMVRRLADAGGRVDARRVDRWWRWDQRADTLLRGNRFALEGLSADVQAPLLHDNQIQGGVVIHPTAHVESSTLRGPAIVGAHAWIRQAYIGPYTSISKGARIEGGEVENSVVLAGASLTHLGDRLEGSIVGPGAEVGRSFGLPKAHHLMVGAGASISLC